MKHSIFTLFLTFVFSFSGFAQNENLLCPSIDVSGGGFGEPGTPASFTVSSNDKLKNFNVRYEWKVSAGTISSGQGTSSITVDTSGITEGTSFTARVKVTGLSENCPNITEETHAVLPKPPPRKPFDSWNGKISAREESVRFKAFTLALVNDWKNKSFIVLKVSEKTPFEQTKNQIKRIIKVAEANYISKYRLIFFVVKSDSVSTVLWIVPTDTGTSECDKDEDCQTVYGKDF